MPGPLYCPQCESQGSGRYRVARSVGVVYRAAGMANLLRCGQTGKNRRYSEYRYAGEDEDAIVAKGGRFDSIKIRLWIDAEVDLRRLRTIRSSVGDETKIRVDTNQSWTPNDALKLLENGAANMVNINFMKYGGIKATRQIIAMVGAMEANAMMW